MGQYDRVMKLLVESNPEAMARFLFNEWRKRQGADAPEIQITSVTLLSEEFQSEELKGDGVWLINGPEGPLYMASVEYQSTLTPIMPVRSLEYLARSKKKHWKLCGKLPVAGVMLFLFDEETTLDCPMIWSGPNGTTAMAYDYLIINLKTVPREEVLALQEPALWPLALMTKGPVNRIIVKEMFDDLLEHKLSNLLPIGNAIASWFLQGSDLSWLNEEYQKMYEIFKDAPAIQWIQESGRADERRKLAADSWQTLLLIISQRFPNLLRPAKAQLRSQTDPARLQKIIRDLLIARNSDEAEKVLFPLQEDTAEEDTDSNETGSPEL